jgi:hypothetical protein
MDDIASQKEVVEVLKRCVQGADVSVESRKRCKHKLT